MTRSLADSSTSHSMAFSHKTQEDDSNYRSLSPLAIVALVLGLLSPAAFIGTLFLFLPAAAVGTASAALASIRRNSETLSGRRLALLGLALAVTFATASQIRLFVRDRIHCHEITVVAQRWHRGLIDKRYEQAMQLATARALSQFQPRAALGQPPTPEVESRAYTLDKLANDPLLQKLSGPGSTELTFVKMLSVPETSQGVTRLTCQFASTDHQGARQHLAVEFARTSVFEKEGDPWRINGWWTVDETGASLTPR